MQSVAVGFGAILKEGGNEREQGCGNGGWSVCCQIAHMLWGAQQQMQCLASPMGSAVGALVASDVELRSCVLTASGISHKELVWVAVISQLPMPPINKSHAVILDTAAQVVPRRQSTKQNSKAAGFNPPAKIRHLHTFECGFRS